MRHTKEQMEQAISAWRTSGLSKKAFCRQHNIAHSSFHYWYKRLNTTSEFGFSEVKLRSQQHSIGHELVFPSGARLIFQGEPTAAWLRELVY
jgi:transposase-like protein